MLRLFTLTFLLVGLLASLPAFGQVAVKNGMTADSHCGQGYCFTAVYNPSSQMVNYTLVVPQGGSQLGWYGIGQGTRMAGANMAVNWVNADMTVTTSHRLGQGEYDPEIAPSTNAFTFNSDVSKTKQGQTVWSWLWPLPSGAQNSVNHIFAMRASPSPASSDVNADIRQHSRYDTDITLDLTKAYTGAAPAGIAGSTQSTTGSGGSSGSSGSESEGDSNKQRNLGDSVTRMWIVHMVFMIAGWMICFPAGILIARYGRTMFLWFPKHRLVQTIGFVFVIVGFFVAIAAVATEGKEHFKNTHEQLGLALFILLFVQILLGVSSHSLKQRKGLRYIGYIHIPFGLVLFGLSVWQIHMGFEEWDWKPTEAASYPIYAWAALMAVLYIAGFAFLPKELRQARGEKGENNTFSSNEEYS